jgi:hypothetical protein
MRSLCDTGSTDALGRWVASARISSSVSLPLGYAAGPGCGTSCRCVHTWVGGDGVGGWGGVRCGGGGGVVVVVVGGGGCQREHVGHDGCCVACLSGEVVEHIE